MIQTQSLPHPAFKYVRASADCWTRPNLNVASIPAWRPKHPTGRHRNGTDVILARGLTSESIDSQDEQPLHASRYTQGAESGAKSIIGVEHELIQL